MTFLQVGKLVENREVGRNAVVGVGVRKAWRRAKQRLQVIPCHMEKPRQKLNFEENKSSEIGQSVLLFIFSQLEEWFYSSDFQQLLFCCENWMSLSIHVSVCFGAGFISGDACATFLFVWPPIEQSGGSKLVAGRVDGNGMPASTTNWTIP